MVNNTCDSIVGVWNANLDSAQNMFWLNFISYIVFNTEKNPMG